MQNTCNVPVYPVKRGSSGIRLQVDLRNNSAKQGLNSWPLAGLNTYMARACFHRLYRQAAGAEAKARDAVLQWGSSWEESMKHGGENHFNRLLGYVLKQLCNVCIQMNIPGAYVTSLLLGLTTNPVPIVIRTNNCQACVYT